MADDSPAGRRRALKRAGFVSAGLLVVFVVVLLAASPISRSSWLCSGR